jgi:CDP-4-dehydro-6-deoxyglucose reductase
MADSGASLLDAASSAGVVLPYSCRSGRCSACKALVQSGETRSITDEIGLSAEEIRGGWILTCVRTAETDVELEIEDLGDVGLAPPKTLPCRISELTKVAPDVVIVRLRLPPSSAFPYIAGQYINVIGPNGIRRSYSLANASHDRKFLELHIRYVDGGAMSDYWFNQAKMNDLLRLNGPLGTFFLRGCANVDVFMLATGTGIAPVKAMIESVPHMPEGQRPQSITVLWGGRKPEDFYVDVAAIPGNHRYIPVISRPHSHWAGARGYVQDILLAEGSDLTNAVVYACGSDNMINGAKKMLSNAGFPLTHFHSDAFVSSDNS